MISKLKNSLAFISVRGVDIHSQLIIEEKILRQTSKNCVIFSHSPRALSSFIVLGFSGKKEELVNIDAVRNHNLLHSKTEGISLIRRFTGGGTVIVDDNTIFVSFIMNNGDVASQPYPRELMSWTEKIYNPVFEQLISRKQHDDMVPVISAQRKFSLRDHDYVIDDRKIGGNAQTITKERFVHHTSFLWNYDAKKMGYLKIPKKRPAYRGDRNHGDFITTLCDKISSVEVFEQTLQNELSQHYAVTRYTDFREILDPFQEADDFQPRTIMESLD